MPGAAVGETQAAQSSHLATKGEEVEAKSVALEPQESMGHWEKGHQREDRELHHSCLSPAASILGGSECIMRKVYKYAV